MSDKKPLSDKKLRRLMKTDQKKLEKKKKKEKKLPDDSHELSNRSGIKLKAFLNKSLPEWQSCPKHLRGKEIGLWHRDRKRLEKQMSELTRQADASSSTSQSSLKKETKLSKKQRKALKKAEQKAQSSAKKAEKESLSNSWKITFDSEREKMIQDYLNSVEDKPPSFLIPLSEYHKKLKANHPSDESNVATSAFEGVNIPADEDPECTLKTTMQLYEMFPSDLWNNLTVDNVQAYLKGELDDKRYEYKIPEKEQQASKRSSNKRSLDESTDLNLDEGFMDSIDKYKHLEETPFKQSFFQILSSNIQENLQRAVKRRTLNRDAQLDKDFYNILRSKEHSSKYRHMLNERRRLPSFQMQNAILDLIRHNQVILISGETGCGKTTQIAQFILDDAISSYNGSMCNIICTQPRRISAISVAQRVADERAETLGRESIGYQIRLERKIGRQRGAILYCTTGILLQYMQGDPALSKYSHIILDEIHERDTLCDFVLTILKDVALKRRDLKIILMSATLNAERFSKYFNNCPQINIPGYTYPVEEFYLEDVLSLTQFQFPSPKQRNTVQDPNFKKHILPYAESLRGKYPDYVVDGLCNPESEKINPDLIVTLIKHICTSQKPGAILVFVPGWEDINAIMRKITEQNDFFTSSSFLVIPLHSMLPSANQQSVFDRPPHGQRKIVIATNIAETSITINDVVYVIDCGKIKVKNYDVIGNISTLKPEFVSLANAHQRRGRAGRVQKGVCYHLFSRGREEILAEYPLPEMLRTRLEEVILSIKLLQLGKAAPFLEKVMDPPNPRAVTLASQLLFQLNALDENENLTPLGFHLAKLPLDPQIGKMLLMAVTMSCLNPILSIAATLSFKDPFHVPLGEERQVKDRKLELDNGHKSDHLIMAEVLDRFEKSEFNGKARQFCTQYYLNRNTLRQLREQKSLFAQYLMDMGFLKNNNFRQKNLNMNSDNIALIKAVICSGLYPNVAVINRKINTGQKKMVLLRTSEDGKVTLHPKSVNTVQTTDFQSNFLLYHEKLLSSCIFIYDTTMVSALPLLVFCYDFYVSYTKESAIIELNKDLRFVCSKKSAYYITELKLRLHWLLEYKLSHPGQVLWKDDTSEIGLLKVLTELFTCENDLVMGAKDDSSDNPPN